MQTFQSGLFQWAFLIINLSAFFVSLLYGTFLFLLNFISWWFIEISFFYHLVQNLLSLIIFPKFVIKVYKSIILIVIHSCASWFLASKEQRFNSWREQALKRCFFLREKGEKYIRKCFIICIIHLFFKS